MYATLIQFKNRSTKVEKDFALCSSILERKFSNSPLYSCVSRSFSASLTFLAILSEKKDTYKIVSSSVEDYVNCMTYTPDWVLEITTSPEF